MGLEWSVRPAGRRFSGRPDPGGMEMSASATRPALTLTNPTGFPDRSPWPCWLKLVALAKFFSHPPPQRAGHGPGSWPAS